MKLPCRHVRNGKMSDYPWRHVASRSAARSAGSTIGQRLPYRRGCQPSSRYRSPPLIVEIAPPVSHLPVPPPRQPYRWAGSCVGRDGGRDSGRGANAIDGMRRKNRFEFFGNCRQVVENSSITANAGTAYLPYRSRIYIRFYSVFRNQSRWISIPFSMQ